MAITLATLRGAIGAPEGLISDAALTLHLEAAKEDVSDADESARKDLTIVQLVKLSLAFSGFDSITYGEVEETPLDYVAEKGKIIQALYGVVVA